MNEKILQQLYYGKIEPVTKKVVEGSNYRKQQKIIDEIETELCDQLDESGKEKLEMLMEAWSELDFIGNEERFVEGFKMGARLMLELFETGEVQLESVD